MLVAGAVAINDHTLLVGCLKVIGASVLALVVIYFLLNALSGGKKTRDDFKAALARWRTRWICRKCGAIFYPFGEPTTQEEINLVLEDWMKERR
jgi:hypothetical protein